MLGFCARRQHNDRDIGEIGAHFAKKRNSILLRHDDVEKDQVDPVVLQKAESLERRVGGMDLVMFLQQEFEGFAHSAVVIYYQNAFHEAGR